MDDALGALSALYRLLDRDLAVLEADAGGCLDCPPDCSECCCANLFVVTGLEFAHLAREARRVLSDEALERIIGEARSQYASFPVGKTLSAERSHRKCGYAGLPCPLLADGRCTVYAARPVTCRLFGRSNFADGAWNGCEQLIGPMYVETIWALSEVESYSALLADLLQRRLSPDALDRVVPLTGVNSLIGLIAATEFDEALIADACRAVRA